MLIAGKSFRSFVVLVVVLGFWFGFGFGFVVIVPSHSNSHSRNHIHHLHITHGDLLARNASLLCLLIKHETCMNMFPLAKQITQLVN